MRLKEITLTLALLPMTALHAQTDTLSLTLNEAIAVAQSQSADAKAAHHTMLAAEWSYKFYKANYLPSLTLTSGSSLNRVISKITLPDGTSSFVGQNQLSTDATVSLTQNIPFTGGQLFVKSSLQRQDEFENKSVAYNSQPVVIGYQQSLFGYNALKWERRMAPLRYEAAKKSFDETMELIASRCSSYFFELASAQTELEIAQYNYASADTMSRYARGRYEIGTITENEMLQLQLNKITAEANVLNAQNMQEEAMQALRSFLALDNHTTVCVEIETEVPDCKADIVQAIQLAHAHNPEPVTYELSRRESRSNIASAKAGSGLKAELYIQFGLSQTGDNLRDSYRSPLDQQYAGVTLSLPLLDWGRGKGQVKIAQSNAMLMETRIEQAYKDFDINISKMVRRFNLQAHRVEIAGRTAALAQQRYEISRRLYMAGKSTILDFNAATSEKDSARRGHIAALQTFWSLYYGLRSMTGGKIFQQNLTKNL